MRYQYTSQGYLNSLKKINKLTIVQQLLIINIIIFILMIMNQSCYDWINQYCALHINNSKESTKIWQFLTSAFVHQTYYHDEIVINGQTGLIKTDNIYIWHILYNMIGLWVFGSGLESIWGKKKFLRYYLTVAIGSGLISMIYIQIINPDKIYTLVGASGAIYGLIVAYTILFPNTMLYLFGMIPVKTKIIGIILCILPLLYMTPLLNSNDNTSHITHIGGVIVGFIYLFYWTKKKRSMRIIKTRKAKSTSMNEIREQKINKILDKINDDGWDALTDAEKKYLTEESHNNHFNQKPN